MTYLHIDITELCDSLGYVAYIVPELKGLNRDSFALYIFSYVDPFCKKVADEVAFWKVA